MAVSGTTWRYLVAPLVALCCVTASCSSESDNPLVRADQLTSTSDGPGTAAAATSTTPSTATPRDTVADGSDAVPPTDEGAPPATNDVDGSTEPPPSTSEAVPVESAGDTDAGASAVGSLTVGDDARTLLDAEGRPFFVQGDAAWSLMVELDRDEVERYIASRKRLGFNSVLVSLIEHRFSSNPPFNRAGDGPFVTPGDFSTPNEAYFEHADWVLRRLADEGFTVFLTPSYTGWIGGTDGWWEEMVANGEDTLHDYGRFVGERYGDLDNIVWVEGGDGNPPFPELVDAIATGIEATDPDGLHTAHLAPDTPPRDFWADAEWLDIDNVYTYEPVYDSALKAYRATSMPYILMESAYENEHDVTSRELRTQVYHAAFTGATGHIFGNNPIWHFDSVGLFPAPVGWEEALDGPGSRGVAAVAAVMDQLDWWELRPDDGEFVTGGIGSGQERIAAAVAEDAQWAAVYVPTQRTVTLDLTLFESEQVALNWYDASTGQPTQQTVVEGDGPLDVEVPGANETGDGDWVLAATAA